MAKARKKNASTTSLPAWLVPVLVAAITVIVFLPALKAGFVSWDDDRNFVMNAKYRGLGPAQLGWMWTTFHLGHYVPLSWMSLGLDYTLWGMNPAGYHATNVVLHAANAVLVYLLARRIFTHTLPAATTGVLAWASALAALLFSLHPLRVESVAWVTERRDVLSMLFMLASILTYLRSLDADTRRDYVLSLALFVCALLSKATSLTLPAVLLILNVYPLRRLTRDHWRPVLMELAPYALLSAATAVMTLIALPHLVQLGLLEKIAVSAYSLVFYLWKTLVPDGLAALYAMPTAVHPLEARYVVSVVILVALSVGAWAVRRQWPSVPAAWVAFLVMILPMLGVVQNGPQIAADRYTYFAAPALTLMLAGAIVSVRGSAEELVNGVALFALGVLGVLTWRQTLVWRDSRALWTQVLAVEPQSAIGQNNMGNVFFQERRFNDAIAHYRRAIASAPNYTEAHNNLGIVLLNQGNFTGAIAEYERAAATNPLDPEPHANLGSALDALGKSAEALAHFERALALDPDHVNAQVNYGSTLLKLNRVDDAVRVYQRAVLSHPDLVEAHLNYGVALARQGRLPEAVEEFRTALVLKAESPEARQYLARLQARLRTY